MKKLLVFLFLIGFSTMSYSLNLNEYKEGFKRGWAMVYEQMGRSVPNAPAPRNPKSQRSGDKRNSYEYGLMEGMKAANERIER